VELWDPATSTWVTSKVTYANGTYEIVGNNVIFVPNSGFTGQAESLLYRITDSNGKTAQATYTPTVTPPAPPVCTTDLIVNGSFELPSLGSPGQMGNFGQGTVPGWRTTASDGQIEIWSSTFNSVPSLAGIPGNQFAELNANFVSTLYQDVATIPGSTISWSFAHRGREGTDTMRLLAGTPGASLSQVGPNFVDGNTAWGRYSGSYTVPAGQTTTRFAFESVSSAVGPTLGNFIDDVKIGPVGACVTAEKSVTPSGPATVGSELTYSIKVTNTDTSGRSTIGLAVTDVIPANTTYVAGSLTPAGGTVTGSTITIPITGNAGTSGVLEPGVPNNFIWVLVGSSAAGTVVTDTASVSQTAAGNNSCAGN
jgi:uncharacterized repeat protein (TIGR01451 family)